MTYIFRFILFIFLLHAQLFATANLSCESASLHENVIISRYQERGLTFLDWNASSQQGSNEAVIQSNQNGFYDISYNNKGELYATISTHELIKLNPLTGQILSNQGLIAGSGITNPPVALLGDKEGFLYSVTSKNSKAAIVKFLPNTPQNTTLVAYVDTVINISSYGGDLAWSEGYLYWTVTSNNVVRLVKVDTNTRSILFNKAINYSNGSTFATSPVPMFNDSEGNLLLFQNNKIYNVNNQTAIVSLKESVIQAINIPTGGANNYEFCASPPAQLPLSCEGTATIFSGSTTSNISLLNLNTGAINHQLSDINNSVLNASGYNKKDNYIWGYNQTKQDGTLLRVGKKQDGSYSSQEFKIPNLLIESYVGDIDDNGHLYLKEGQGNTVVHVIDLDPSSATYLTKIRSFNLSQTINIHDWAFNPIDQKLYAVEKSSNILYKINGTNGTVLPIGNTDINSSTAYGASVFDRNGLFYVYNNGGKIYKIDVQNSSIALAFSQSLSVINNDGAMCSDALVGENNLTGIFNIERSNSAYQTIASTERNAWYTQIVGRDFDYSFLFYDENMTMKKAIDNVTIKIELINEESNQSIYTRYAHIKNSPTIGRINITSGINASLDDLSSLPASKRARFRVSYGVDGNGSILQANCTTSPTICFNSFLHIKYNDAQDNFAIRPERFFIQVKDGNNEKINSQYPNNTLRVTAGYEYNLSVIATQFNTHLGSKDYNKTWFTHFDFNSTGLNSCPDTTSISENINFSDGIFQNPNFSHDNVGSYNLTLVADSNWTAVDSQKGDCLLNNASTSATSIQRSGCNIVVQQHGINLKFHPYKFQLDLAQNNLPSNSHPDFIYMSALNKDYHETGIQFIGKILSKSKNNINTTNFVNGCMAEDLQLSPLATLKTEDGLITAPQRILTSSHYNPREAINLVRMERFNNEDFNLSNYNTVAEINSTLAIPSTRFLLENNGTVDMDIRYNLQKHLSKTINPVQITFDTLLVQSENAYSEGNNSTHYIPRGTKDLNNSVRNFYFTQVVSDSILYPLIHFPKTKVIRTPLNVDIFCNSDINYCRESNVFKNSVSSPRKQQGWYLSVNHNPLSDGKVTLLTPVPNNLTPSSTPLPLPAGRNSLLFNTLNSCSASKIKVKIHTDKPLEYHPNGASPYYEIQCTLSHAEFTGIGQSGNIIRLKGKLNIGGKVDW